MGWGTGNLGNKVASIPTKISTVREDDESTMTLTYKNGITSEIVIKYDNGDPVKITVDGEEIELEWISTGFWLFLNGDQFEDVTGGWEAVSGGVDGTYGKQPTLTFSGNVMTAEFSPTRITVGQVKTKNAVDLTDYSTLTFHLTAVTDPAGESKVGVIDDTGEHISILASATPVVGDNVIDISGLSGSYKVGIVLKTTDSKNGQTLVSTDSIGLE